MTLFAFIGVAVTSSTTVIFGETIADPTVLVGRIGGGLVVAVSLLVLSVATLSTNIAANVVSPANALINLAPRRISFRAGSVATALVGMLMMPWKLIEDPSGYIFVWLGGIGTLLGPVTGILVADTFIVRRGALDLDALYRADGAYAYTGGYNPVAFGAFFLGVLPSLPGFAAAATGAALPPGWEWAATIYQQAWFVGFFLGMLIYAAAMKRPDASTRAA